jgi:uncharacterized repeat protein (TIGR02543 family)
VDLAGSAETIGETVTRVSWENLTTHTKGDAIGTDLWSCEAVPLKSNATNVIVVTATAPSGFPVNGGTTTFSETLSVLSVPMGYKLTLSESEHGTVTVAPDWPTYPAGTAITLHATPNAGFVFIGWSGDNNEEGNPPTINLTMDGDKNVIAMFRPVILPEIKGVAFDPVARSVSLTWSSHRDAVYEIEMSTDLVAWVSIQTKLGIGERTTAAFSVPNDVSQRFYRLREEP